jgi:hypothetical protein
VPFERHERPAANRVSDGGHVVQNRGGGHIYPYIRIEAYMASRGQVKKNALGQGESGTDG